MFKLIDYLLFYSDKKKITKIVYDLDYDILSVIVILRYPSSMFADWQQRGCSTYCTSFAGFGLYFLRFQWYCWILSPWTWVFFQVANGFWDLNSCLIYVNMINCKSSSVKSFVRSKRIFANVKLIQRHDFQRRKVAAPTSWSLKRGLRPLMKPLMCSHLLVSFYLNWSKMFSR